MNGISNKRINEMDQKKYIVEKNKELLGFMRKAIKNGYQPTMQLEELQDIIDTINWWYEIKCPERKMNCYEDRIYYADENLEVLSHAMTPKQLLFRLTKNQQDLIEGNYRINSKETTNPKKEISIKLTSNKQNKKAAFYLTADSTGKIKEIDDQLKKYTPTFTTLDEMLIGLKENNITDLNYSELEKCVLQHTYDVELRRQLLQAAALKLLYSKKTEPDKGYERAKIYINEFRREYHINITSSEVDKLIKGESYSEKLDKLIQKHTTNLKEETDSLQEDNLFRKQTSKAKVKQFIQKTFSSNHEF